MQIPRTQQDRASMGSHFNDGPSRSSAQSNQFHLISQQLNSSKKQPNQKQQKQGASKKGNAHPNFYGPHLQSVKP